MNEKELNDSIIKPLSLKNFASFMGVDFTPDELAEMEEMSQKYRRRYGSTEGGNTEKAF